MSPTADRIPVDESAALELARALVRLRTVNDPSTGSSELSAATLVAETMRSFGWEPLITEVAPGRPNVVAVIEGGAGAGPTLMFEGHSDVVTEGDPSDWSCDPFGAEVLDGRLLGRGSADMKAGLAAMIYAARALELEGPFPGRLVVGALVDEEGLMLGAKHFARTALAAEVDGVIIGEPEGGEVCAVAKGAIRLRLDLVGAMAHGAMPQHGRNPIAAVPGILAGIAERQTGLQEELGEHEHLGWCYLTPTVVAAGDLDQMNVIPARCSIGLDIRTVPGVDHGALVGDIVSAARVHARSHEVGLDYEVVDDRPAVDTPVDHPVVRALVEAHELVRGERPPYGGVPGATDGTILTRDAGLATVVYGPGGKWIAHQADEYVEVAEIGLYARVYAEAARRFLTTGQGVTR